MNTLFTRSRAEAWREANPTPTPAKLTAFLLAYPRLLPQPAPPISQGLYKTTLYLLGAVALSVLGWLL